MSKKQLVGTAEFAAIMDISRQAVVGLCNRGMDGAKRSQNGRWTIDPERAKAWISDNAPRVQNRQPIELKPSGAGASIAPSESASVFGVVPDAVIQELAEDVVSILHPSEDVIDECGEPTPASVAFDVIATIRHHLFGRCRGKPTEMVDAMAAWDILATVSQVLEQLKGAKPSKRAKIGSKR